MDRYRILFFTSSLRVGGAEHHILNLCRFLSANGHEPAVCTLSSREEGLESVLVEEGIPLYRIPLRSLRYLPSARVVRGMRRMAADFRPHIIHAHLFHAEAAALAASLVTGVPAVATRHSAGLEFGGWRAAVSRMVARRFAACIAVSREAAAEARGNGWSAGKVTVLANAVDPQRFRPLEASAREKLRLALSTELFGALPPGRLVLVGSAGGLRPVKNFSLLVRAVSTFARDRVSPREDPVVRVVIFGEGEERDSLERLARELGVESFLALPGRRDDLESVFPLLDIFALPSLTEGVPLALLEAMSSGVACVASEVGGVGEVAAGVCLLVAPGDERGLVRALQEFVLHEDTRLEIGRKARVRILERHNVDIWGSRILDVYREALARVGHRQPPGGSRAPGSGPLAAYPDKK